VRELENVMAMAMVTMLPKDKVMKARHLPPLAEEASCRASISSGKAEPLKNVLEDAESRAIIHALKETDGSRTKAASLLGVSMRSLFYKIQKHGIRSKYT